MNNKIGIILCICIFIVYFGNSSYLAWKYPYAATDLDVWLDFYQPTRVKIYEVLFLLCFLSIYINAKGITKAIGGFLSIVGFGSVIDKVFLGIHSFMWYDHIIIAIAIAFAVYIYLKEKGNFG